MFEEAISLLSIWASMNTWLTPTVLFLLLNLMIGTIFLTSGLTSSSPTTKSHPPDHHQPPHQPPQHHSQHQSQYSTLTRSPSVLQRLKSINLYSFSTHFQQPDPTPVPEPESKPEPEIQPTDNNENDESPTLDEVYSRIKQENNNPFYGRQNSDTKPSGGELPVKLPKKMMKSASDKSAFSHFHFDPSDNNQTQNNNNVNEDENTHAHATTIIEDDDDDVEVEEVEDEDAKECVDAKADDFINRFRKQLQMQRNDSIVNNYKAMISRTSVQ